MERVEHLDGPAQPCGSGTGRGRYAGMNYGLPSSAAPMAETVRANAIVRVRRAIAEAELRITTASNPIDRAFVPYWREVADAGYRALALMEVQS